MPLFRYPTAPSLFIWCNLSGRGVRERVEREQDSLKLKFQWGGDYSQVTAFSQIAGIFDFFCFRLHWYRPACHRFYLTLLYRCYIHHIAEPYDHFHSCWLISRSSFSPFEIVECGGCAARHPCRCGTQGSLSVSIIVI